MNKKQLELVYKKAVESWINHILLIDLFAESLAKYLQMNAEDIHAEITDFISYFGTSLHFDNTGQDFSLDALIDRIKKTQAK